MNNKPTLRLHFCDMWGHGLYQFNPEDNYFYDLLSLKYNIELDSISPDVLIYSCFGLDHLNYRCFKIFFSGENIPNSNPHILVNPDYNQCNISLSKFPSSDQNLYFPLWALFINWFGKSQPRRLPSNPTYSTALSDLLNTGPQRSLNGFQNRENMMFINNNFVKDRVMLFLELERRIHVDSYGQLFNNVSSPLRGSELDKHNLLLSYKSTIAFENSYYPGYNTEKIIQPYAAGCVAVYSGGLDETIFNKKAMIFAQDFSTRQDLVERIMLILKNESAWEDCINQPLFINNKIPDNFDPNYIIEWICSHFNYVNVEN